MSEPEVCPDCGREVSGLEREVTFGLPDELFALSERDQARRLRRVGKSFVTLDSDRFFLRVLLPVQLDIRREYRFGVWMELSEHAYKKIWAVWDEPEYASASVDGVLANAVPPWGDVIYGAACSAASRNATDAMFIASSTQPNLARVLTEPWAVHECEQLIANVWGDAAADDG